MKFRLFVFLLALVVMGSSAAEAGITAASRGVPGTKNIANNTPATFTVTWRIVRNGGAGPYTVEADDGELHLGSSVGPTIGTVNNTLSRTVNPPGAPNLFTLTFTDTITIPRAALRQAAEAGQPIIYLRNFTDDNFATSRDVTITINVTGGMGGDLHVSRSELRFDNGATACTAQTGVDLTATAFISTQGSGVLRGNWQVREGGGYGSFRTLKSVQVPVSAGQDIKLKSPVLPTDKNQRIDVRFDVTTPDDTGADTPIISCALLGNDAQAKSVMSLKTTPVTSPLEFAPLHETTKIEWTPVPGAKAYRVDILAEKNGAPVASQAAKAGSSHTSLSPLTLEKLDPSRRYIVRVVVE